MARAVELAQREAVGPISRVVQAGADSAPVPSVQKGEPGTRVCPRCAGVFAPAEPGCAPVEWCPTDGFALVLERDFELSGGDVMLGRTIDGRFTIVGRLGIGSMGAVYRAWEGAAKRWVALKIMRYDRAADRESRVRFEREARAMSQLVSPHTVSVYNFGQAEDGSVYLAMELLEGESLGTRLRRRKRMPITEAVSIARQALVSLAEAHSKGIVHRDLKPDNLFLRWVPGEHGRPPYEVCKLLDFGIAKLLWAQPGMDALQTQAGTVFGTPRYMSPEQAQGRPLDARSDLYSLGVILYQMVTGKVPFDDEEAVVVMARHIKARPRPPTEVAPHLHISVQLEQVILQALSKDPKLRPQSAEAFIQTLDSLDLGGWSSRASTHAYNADADGTGEHALPTLVLTARPQRRPWVPIGLAAVVLVGLLGTAGWLGWRRLSSRWLQAPVAAASALSEPAAGGSAFAGAAASVGEAIIAVDSLPVADSPNGSKGTARGRSSAEPASSSSAPPARKPSAAAAPAGSGSTEKRP